MGIRGEFGMLEERLGVLEESYGGIRGELEGG